MKYLYSLFIILVLFVTVPVVAQTVDPEEDPFENDPFFTRPIKDWFSAEEVRERVRRTSVRLFTDEGVDDGIIDVYGNSNRPGVSSLDVMHPAVRFNRVEALYIGFHSERGLKWNWDRDLSPFGSIGYSFGRKSWLYTVGIERVFGMNRNVIIGASHHRITDSEDTWRTGWTETSIMSFFSPYDFMDYYSRNGTQIYTVLRPSRDVEFTAGYSDDRYRSLEKNSNFSVFGRKIEVRDNPEIDEGKIQLLTLAVKLNPSRRNILDRFSISADFTGEFSDVIGYNSDYEFRRYIGEVRSAWLIDRSALLKNRVRVHATSNGAPDFKQVQLGGISTLRARSHKEFSGTHAVLMNTELHLGSQAGRGGHHRIHDFADLQSMKFILFADMGWTDTLPGNSGIMSGFEDFSVSKLRTDIGAGINFNAFRLEAARKAQDLSERPVIWIRFNPTF